MLEQCARHTSPRAAPWARGCESLCRTVPRWTVTQPTSTSTDDWSWMGARSLLATLSTCDHEAMTLPRKLMIDGEQTVMTTRTHVKALLVPLIILLAVSAAGAFLAGTVWDTLWGGQPVL